MNLECYYTAKHAWATLWNREYKSVLLECTRRGKTETYISYEELVKFHKHPCGQRAGKKNQNTCF